MNVRIITNTEVEAIEGEAGRFLALLKTYPRFIDLDKCTGCGVCAQACPVSAVNEFNVGLDSRAAVSIRYPQAVPLVFSIDPDTCVGCGLCETVCLAKAIRYDDTLRRMDIEVGAVILAGGNEVFDPSPYDTYGYASSPNVITSLEFERILSASGPFRGHLMRPYDREEPKKIAWLQCVGSRDVNTAGNPYCSAVCCMYAVKEAVIAKEHAHGPLDTAIFYMDMRTYGKDFDQYYERAREEHGVRFIRSRVHSILPVGDGDLEIQYVGEDGEPKQEVFNLVVLSVGFRVGQELVELAQRLGVELNQYRFAKTDSFAPVATSRPGIFVCGTFQGPKDIPQAVVEASAAAASSGVLLNDARWTATREMEVPAQTDIRGEVPRVGVFVCHCGINIGGVVNVPEVREFAKRLPFVVYAEENLYTCSQDTQMKMAEVIRKKGINRVVVAACTPRTHEPLFQETLVNAGLNRYLFEMANIRNQVSWVHKNDRVSATEKAKDLVRMAVAKATLLEPLQDTEVPLNPVSLVIGGGIAGLTAARTLAEQGYEVHIVERTPELGGAARSLFKTWRGESVQSYLRDLEQQVEANPLIHVHCSAEVTNVEGFVGNFTTTIQPEKGDSFSLNHGITILATGAGELKPDEYLYGKDPRVVTHLELDARFIQGDESLKEVRSAVFIQCVGSREPNRPYCSRVCCTHSVESALELKRRNPDMDIYVLYRDVRTYGEREDLYTKARGEGIIFVRYDPENRPQVRTEDAALQVTVTDPILGRPLRIEPDLLVLATAVVPSGNDLLAQFFKVPLNSDGFFVEAHAKLRPVDFATEGVFVCGLAHYPKAVDESIAQALAASARAMVLLTRGKVFVSGAVAETVQALCSGCGTCVAVCPYSAAGLNVHGKSEINSALCKGCGLCTASCRSGAIRLHGFDDAQVFAMIENV